MIKCSEDNILNQMVKGHLSYLHLVNTTKKCGVDFHCFVTFHFCFTNFHCNENSATILCFVTNNIVNRIV